MSGDYWHDWFMRMRPDRLLEGFSIATREIASLLVESSVVSVLSKWRRGVEDADGWHDVDGRFARYGLSSMSDVFRELGRIVFLKVLEE